MYGMGGHLVSTAVIASANGSNLMNCNRPVFAFAMLIFLASAALRTNAGEGGVMPPVPPTVEEVLATNAKLKADSDVVAKLRVESVDRFMSYGGVCIELRSSWYVARCRVVNQLHGELPEDMETIDVIFWTKTHGTILGFYLPPERRKRDGFANHVSLERRIPAKGKPNQFELVAFLRGTGDAHPLEEGLEAPTLFVPTSGYGLPEKALISLGGSQVVEKD